MLESNQTHGQRNHGTQSQSERRWDPAPERREVQRDLIKELGQLQITPGGFGC